jgi:hypothetical protein
MRKVQKIIGKLRIALQVSLERLPVVPRLDGECVQNILG